MEEYVVQIRDGWRKTYHKRKSLYELGFEFINKSKTNKYWEKKNVSKEDVKTIKKYCKMCGFKINIIDQRFARSGNYRSEFFEHYKPVFKNFYFCVYCGIPVSIKKLQVDHIIPVHKAKTNKKVQRYLNKKKLEGGVNDYHNLAASCRQCNLSKGAKMGLWTIRGKIGKSNVFQLIRWGIRLVLFGIVLYWLYEMEVFDTLCGMLHF